MILGVEIENFDVFDKDRAGILIEESIRLTTGIAILTLLSDATIQARPVSWDAFHSFRMS